MSGPQHQRTVTVPDHVLVESLAGSEMVFLNLATEEYFGLDSVGAAMWDALTETGRTDLALERLLDEFDVDSDRLTRDFRAFLAKLVERDLLRLSEEPNPADS